MRLAIVGCGLIGGKRAAAAAAHDDRRRLRSRRRARRANSRRTPRRAPSPTGGKRSRADVDAVIVATTHDQLAAIALGAVEAGKHVLVEKPAGRELAEVQAVAGGRRKAQASSSRSASTTASIRPS